MANFSIQTSIQVIPLEEITFTDTSQKAKGIHSTIDKSFSNQFTLPCGTNATKIEASTKTLPGTTLTQLDGLVTGGTHVYYLYFRNISATSITISLKYSNDGVNYHTISQVAKNGFVFLTPDVTTVSFYFDNPNAADATIEIITYTYNEV